MNSNEITKSRKTTEIKRSHISQILKKIRDIKRNRRNQDKSSKSTEITEININHRNYEKPQEKSQRQESKGIHKSQELSSEIKLSYDNDGEAGEITKITEKS